MCENDVLFLKIVVVEKKLLEYCVSSLLQNRLALRATVVQLKRKNEGLSIQLKTLEKDLLEKEKIMEEQSAVVGDLGDDMQLLMKEGLIGVVDHILESTEFGYEVNKFQDACVVAGKALEIQQAKEFVCVGSQLEGVVDNDVDHEATVEEALEAFASLDYTFFLELHRLDVKKLKQMV